jgi:hypothetical protein
MAGQETLAAAPYMAALEPGLKQLAALVCAVPDDEVRITVALHVASYLLGTACGAMQATNPALKDVKLSEVAEHVSEQILGLMRERDGRVN